MGDISRATEAIINLLEPIIEEDNQESANKVYETLSAVIDYPNVEFSDKLSIIHGVARFLIRNCGVDSLMTVAALRISIEHNNMLN